MLHICVEGRFVLELHHAAEGVAFSARRNVGAYVGLKESGDYALEGGNLSLGSFDLCFRGSRLPLKGEDVKDARRPVFRSRRWWRTKRDEGGGTDRHTAIAQQGT